MLKTGNADARFSESMIIIKSVSVSVFFVNYISKYSSGFSNMLNVMDCIDCG